MNDINKGYWIAIPYEKGVFIDKWGNLSNEDANIEFGTEAEANAAFALYKEKRCQQDQNYISLLWQSR